MYQPTFFYMQVGKESTLLILFIWLFFLYISVLKYIENIW